MATSKTLLARAGEIKQPKRRETLIANAEQARISKRLVTLSDDVPLETPLDGLERRKLDVPRLLDFLKANDFRSLATRIMTRHGGDGSGAGRRWTPRRRAARRRSRARRSPRCRSRAAGAVAPTVPVDFGNYELVQDKAALERWMREARDAGFVAFDTETTSLHVIAAELVGVSLALAPGKACYIPLGHGGAGRRPAGRRRSERPTQIPLDRGARPPEAAARGPVGPEDRPEHQVRHLRPAANTASTSRRSTTPC